MENEKNTGVIIGIALLIMFSIYIGYTGFLFYISWPIEEFSLYKSSLFGDSFNFISCFFSGLAFIGLVWAILLQRKDLKLQREDLLLQRTELELTREELRGQKEQLQIQNESIKIQNAENTFYKMLNFYDELKENISYAGLSGNKALYTHYNNFRAKFSHEKFENGGSLDDLRRVYNNFEYSNDRIIPCITLLYDLVEFIDKHEIRDKDLYAKILVSLLSSTEQGMIFYHALNDLPEQNFKSLIEKYKLLKGMPVKILCNINHKEFYDNNAFG